MAKKKKGGAMLTQVATPHSEHSNTSIDSAENGYIVHVSGSSGGKNPSYYSKRFIASSHPAALRLAAHHHAGGAKGKAGKKKMKALKKSA